MKITKLALFLLFGALFGSRMALAQAPGQDDAGTRYFHQRLSPYGEWGTHASYGEVWRPRVAAGWRPYTTGHWVYTDYGWTWAADESWGWAPFHYGRWYNDPAQGWGWVPGNVWAPAWVDWRNGGGYLGWAALPPEAGFSVGVGVSFGAALGASNYCFVPERSILEPRLGGFLVAPGRNEEILRGTSNLHGIAVVNGRVFNQGMSAQRFAQVSGHAVPTVRVGSQAAFYRPAVVAAAARQTGSESFVNRPAPRVASAAARPVPAGSRSATLPNQGQNGHSAVSRSRTQRASSNHVTPPTQGRANSGPVAHSHAAAVKPPQATQKAAPGANRPARHVASANQPQRGTQRTNPAPRHVASANQQQHGAQQASANPPARHAASAAAAPQHSAAHAPAQAKPRQPPPPRGEQPQGPKQQSDR